MAQKPKPSYKTLRLALPGMLKDVPDLDVLVIPVGGGGLLAGCATAAKALKPGIAVFGVEVAAYSAMAQRLAK